MSPSDNSPRIVPPATAPTGTIEDIAAAWLARRESGLSADEQAEFSRWLLADPEHAASAERLAATWARLRQPQFNGQAVMVERLVEARVRTGRSRLARKIWVVAWGGLAAAALGLALLPMGRGPAVASAVPVAIETRPDRRTLADGSVVEFNAGAVIEVDFSPLRRDVRLVRGEAHFAVRKDSARPFVVTAGGVAVRAVGTAFSVRVAPQEIGVLVTEGQVAVERVAAAEAAARSGPTLVSAGRRLAVALDSARAVPIEPTAVARAEIEAELAWRNPRVEFTAMPLAEAVALFNGRNRLQLALADPALAGIPISGLFPSDDPETFSRLVIASAGLQATRAADGTIVLRR
jgi:transmembrane sensor